MILSAGINGVIAVSSPLNGATLRVVRDHKGATITTIQCVNEQVRPRWKTSSHSNMKHKTNNRELEILIRARKCCSFVMLFKGKNVNCFLILLYHLLFLSAWGLDWKEMKCGWLPVLTDVSVYGLPIGWRRSVICSTGYHFLLHPILRYYLF